MARGINKVFLVGNVGKDPEIRSTAGGTVVANFSLATVDRQKDQQGNWQDKTEWHYLITFNRTAEIARDYVKKGAQLFIEGKIQTRLWEKDGRKQYRTEILVAELHMLGVRENGSKDSILRGVHKDHADSEPNHHGEYITDADIPF